MFSYRVWYGRGISWGLRLLCEGTATILTTENCDAERKALAVTWCTFQLFLQQVWRWLLYSKNGINKNHRHEVMAAVIPLVYAGVKRRFL